ncbi:hypothetical protein CCP4SC76_2460006 [Gammaproteobacteria bacterium]
MAQDLTLGVKIAVQETGTENLDKVNKSIAGVGNSAASSAPSVITLNNALGVAEHLTEYAKRSAETVLKIAELADEFRVLQSRIGIATEDTEHAALVMDKLVDISNRTHAPLQATAELFSRLAQATKGTGIETQQLLTFSESINNALRVNGTSASEASGALLQLSQAMASGTLRGEEFNSVNEQMPAVLDAVAGYLGKTRGELKKMAEDGALSSQVVLYAVNQMGDAWKKQAESMPTTVKGAITDMQNAWMQYVGTSKLVADGSGVLSSTFGALAQHMSGVLSVAEDFINAGLDAKYAIMVLAVSKWVLSLKDAYVAQQAFNAAQAENAVALQVTAQQEEKLAALRLESATADRAAKTAQLEATKAVQIADAELLATKKVGYEADLQSAIATAEAKKALSIDTARTEMAAQGESSVGAQASYEKQIAAAEAAAVAEIAAAENTAKARIAAVDGAAVANTVAVTTAETAMAESNLRLVAAIQGSNLSLAEKQLLLKGMVVAEEEATVATGVLATAMRGLATVGNLLVGPAGIIALMAGMWAYEYIQSENAKNSAEGLTKALKEQGDAIDKLTKSQLQDRLNKQNKLIDANLAEMASINEQVEALKKSVSEYELWNKTGELNAAQLAEMGKKKENLSGLEAKYDVLVKSNNESLKSRNATQDRLNELTGAHSRALEEQSKAQGKAVVEFQNAKESYTKFSKSIELVITATESQIKAKQEEIKVLQQYASLIPDEIEKKQELARLATEEATNTQLLADAKNVEALAKRALLTQEQERFAQLKVQIPAEKEALDNENKKIQAMEAEAKAAAFAAQGSQARAISLKLEAETSKNNSSRVEELKTKYDEIWVSMVSLSKESEEYKAKQKELIGAEILLKDALKDRLELQTSSINKKVAELNAEESLIKTRAEQARALGDETTATELMIQASQKVIEKDTEILKSKEAQLEYLRQQKASMKEVSAEVEKSIIDAEAAVTAQKATVESAKAAMTANQMAATAAKDNSQNVLLLKEAYYMTDQRLTALTQSIKLAKEAEVEQSEVTRQLNELTKLKAQFTEEANAGNNESATSLRDVNGEISSLEERQRDLNTRIKEGTKAQGEIGDATDKATKAHAAYNDAVKDRISYEEKSESLLKGSISLYQKQQANEMASIKNQIDLAKARGDEVAVQKLSEQQTKAEIKAAQDAVDAKSAELQAEINLGAAKIEQIKNSSLSDVEKKQEIASIQQKIAALGLERDALQQTADATEKMAKASHEAANSDKEWEASRIHAGETLTSLGAVLREQWKNTGMSVAYFDEQLRKLPPSARAGWTELHHLEEQMIEIQKAQKESGFLISQFADKVKDGTASTQDLARWTKQAEEAEYALARAAQENIESLNRLPGAARSATQTVSEMSRINAADLDKLKQAIDAAKNALKAMEDQARSGLNAALDELDQLNNNQEAIENRRYNEKMDELNKQLAAAKKANDQDAINNIKANIEVQDEIHRKKMQNIQDEQNAQQQAATDTTNHQRELDQGTDASRSQMAEDAKNRDISNIDTVAEHKRSSNGTVDAALNKLDSERAENTAALDSANAENKKRLETELSARLSAIDEEAKARSKSLDEEESQRKKALREDDAEGAKALDNLIASKKKAIDEDVAKRKQELIDANARKEQDLDAVTANHKKTLDEDIAHQKQAWIDNIGVYQAHEELKELNRTRNNLDLRAKDQIESDNVVHNHKMNLIYDEEAAIREQIAARGYPLKPRQ